MCSLPSLWFRRLWTPAQITTALWLDAADSSTITLASGAVSQWNDKSGNGRNASQGTAASRPVIATGDLNGKHTISFDGSNDFLSVNRGLYSGTSYSIFILATPDQGTEGYLFQLFNYPNTQSAIITKYSSISYEYFFGNTRFTIGNPSLSGYNILSYDFNVTNVSGYANGQPSGSGAVSSISLEFRQIANALTANELGYSNNAQTKIAELIILPTTSNESTRQKVEGYLAHKWGLTVNLPSNHPFKNYPPRGL